MNIAFIYTHLGQGGGSYQLLRLASSLAATHNVTLYTEVDNAPNSYKDIKKRIHIKQLPRLSVFQGSNKFYFLIDDLLSSISLAWQMRKFDFDLINPHEHPSQLAAVFLKLLKGKKVIWMCNDVWHIPGYEEEKEKRMIFYMYKYTFGWWINMMLTFFIDTIVVLDHRIQRIIKEKYKKNAMVVRSGIDLERFNKIDSKNKVRKELGMKNKFTFLCYSIFFPHRRFEDAIRAFSKLDVKNNSQLYIIGSSRFAPTYYKKIKKLVYSLGLEEQVYIIDKFLPSFIQKAYYSACDIFVFPNENQTWGLAVIEAMATGRPSIISNGAGVSEIITPTIGYVYPVREVNKLSHYMNKTIKNKKKNYAMGRAARSYVFSHFSWDKYADRMYEIFSS